MTVIIPTKDRPEDLVLTVESLFRQSVAAHRLIIVDQSCTDESRSRVELAYSQASVLIRNTTSLCYIHDPTVTGAAMARNRAMDLAEGDVWLFLDDDVYMEPDFLEQILAVYTRYPDVAGVSGIVTNYPPQPLIFRCWSRMFVRGPFCDERQPIYWRANDLRNSDPLPVRKFGGGLMSFRRDVIAGLRFDENLRGVCDGEDVDFCARLEGGGLRLVIAPRARLVHKQSPAGRLQDHWVRRHARAMLFLFNKHWSRGIKNRFCAAWLFVGYGVATTVAALRRGSPEPWQSLAAGIRDARQVTRTRSGVSLAEKHLERT